MFVELAADFEDPGRCKEMMHLGVDKSDLLIVGVYVSDVELVGPCSYDWPYRRSISSYHW